MNHHNMYIPILKKQELVQHQTTFANHLTVSCIGSTPGPPKSRHLRQRRFFEAAEQDCAVDVERILAEWWGSGTNEVEFFNLSTKE